MDGFSDGRQLGLASRKLLSDSGDDRLPISGSSDTISGEVSSISEVMAKSSPDSGVDTRLVGNKDDDEVLPPSISRMRGPGMVLISVVSAIRSSSSDEILINSLTGVGGSLSSKSLLIMGESLYACRLWFARGPGVVGL